MQYRREIDGLRAVAVLPVILYHAGLPVFAGGYAGVDVFFVISGYLITSIILQQLEAGAFSLRQFYARRARRILPALFLVMLVSIPFAWLWMPPEKYIDFSLSLSAVVVFISNILFWYQSGYFAAAGEEKPLLHTWSLGVEEQYYLFFPLLMLALWRYGRRVPFLTICGLALSSLVLAEYLSRTAPDLGFYLAPSRIWELLTGSICAYVLFPRRGPFEAPGIAALGLALIIAAMLAFDDATLWPSSLTLIPVAGTALVILFAGAGTATKRLLSLSPIVGVGLISYSLYLWHQPLFAFARIRMLNAPGVWEMLGLSLLSLPLAYLSWRFVELPFRRQQIGGRISLGLGGLVALLLIVFGIMGHYHNGFPKRMGAEAALQKRLGNQPHSHEGDRCLASWTASTSFDQHVRTCWLNGNASHSVVLIGDSHARVIARALADQLARDKLNLLAFTTSGCLPVNDLHVQGFDVCAVLSQELMAWLVGPDSPPVVVLVGRWALFLEGSRFDNGEGGREAGNHVSPDVAGSMISTATTREERVADAYAAYLRRLLALGKKLVVVHQIPEAGWDVPDRLAKLARYRRREALVVDTSLDRYLARNQRSSQALERVQGDGIIHVYPDQVLCDAKTRRCLNADGHRVLYQDDDHLSDQGAALVAPLITDAVETLLHQ